jgi:uncharacterized protein (DUF1778 family)
VYEAKKRKITPHKGGRDNWLQMRVTKEEKNLIKKAAQSENKSISDWAVDKAKDQIRQPE